MTFVVQDAKLYNHIDASLIRHPELKEKPNDNNNRKKRIY